MTGNGLTWYMEYDANGMRTKREISSTTTAQTYKYVYNGSSLSRMTVGTNVLDFSYGAEGTPMAVVYNGTTYYYVTNAQGDVTALLNSSGTVVVRYTYDAWGKILSTTGSMASTLGTHNPLVAMSTTTKPASITCKADITIPQSADSSMQTPSLPQVKALWATICLPIA
ncbi:MAG: hypothetical protein IJ274_13205 [Lachnospiraceae bacterium]|nr:hypothetical protein [Lachnospiraceae bacterium]